MQNPILMAIMAASVAIPIAHARDYPLTVKEMSASEARSMPGNGGGFASLQSTPGPKVLKAPKTISSRAMYGSLTPYSPDGKATGMLVMFDESQGTGKGYDRMYLDMNGNGDLSDEKFLKPADKDPARPSTAMVYFGPVKLPKTKTIGQWQPSFYVEMYTYQNTILSTAKAKTPTTVLNGYARFYSASYLETALDIGGAQQKAAIVDGNCNFVMGDLAELIKLNNTSETYYPRQGDFLVRDTQGSGKFQSASRSKGVTRLASVVYVDSQPFSLTLSKDLKTLSLSPYAGPLKTLVLKPEFASAVLGWEKTSGKWELLDVEFKSGKAQVPEGTLRLRSFYLGGKAQDGSTVLAGCSSYPGSKTFVASTANSTLKDAGEPLSITLTAEPINTAQSPSLVGSLLNRGGSSKSEDTSLRLSLVIQGNNREKYSSFLTTFASGDTRSYEKRPQWEILGPDGKRIDSGNFEYG